MKTTTSTYSPCPECSDNMDEISVPEDRVLLDIPFTDGLQLILRYWRRDHVCASCEREKYDERYRGIYEAGQEKAYYEGLKEGLNR